MPLARRYSTTARLNTKARDCPIALACFSTASSMASGIAKDTWIFRPARTRANFGAGDWYAPASAARRRNDAPESSSGACGVLSFAALRIDMESPEGIEGGYQGCQFGGGLGVNGAQFGDAAAIAYGIGEGFATAQRRIKIDQGRGIGDASGGIRIVTPGNIGGIEKGDGAKRAAPGAVRFGDKGGHIVERPNIHGAGQEGDKDNIGGKQPPAKPGRIAAPRIDHHIIKRPGASSHQGMKGGPIGAGFAWQGRGSPIFGAYRGGMGGASLAVTIHQKDGTPGTRKGYGEVYGDRRFAGTAFRVAYNQDHPAPPTVFESGMNRA